MKQLKFIVVFLLLISCNQAVDKEDKANVVHFEGLKGTISIEDHPTKHIQILWEDGDTVQWDLPYDIYQLKTLDFNGNGNDEILVGVVKKTRFDPQKNKRLFIFKIFEKEIRPLWMGSKVAHPLDHFTTQQINDSAYIITREIKTNGDTLYGFYVSAPFGISWIKHEKNISSKFKADFQ